MKEYLNCPRQKEKKTHSSIVLHCFANLFTISLNKRQLGYHAYVSACRLWKNPFILEKEQE